jgi:peptidyl-prolyl cis-trans isomerase SurA
LRSGRNHPAQDGIEDKVKTSIRNGFRTGSLTIAGLASVMVMPIASAQQDAQGNISIPENVKIFTENNPNLRRATAVVNGDVVTGTDVDQRLALILAANENKVTAEEKTRLRLQVLRNLIDETLQIQAAKNADIEISPASAPRPPR